MARPKEGSRERPAAAMPETVRYARQYAYCFLGATLGRTPPEVMQALNVFAWVELVGEVLPGDPIWLDIQEIKDARCKVLEKRALESLERAQGGDAYAHDEVSRSAAELTSHGKPLPHPLQQYITVSASAFTRHQGRPRKLLGQDFLQCLCIAAAVDLVVAQGIKRTRNRSLRADDAHPTACSIVEEVLKHFGINKTEDAVEKIWERYSQRRLTTFPQGALLYDK
jgi:hypothetical protein